MNSLEIDEIQSFRPALVILQLKGAVEYSSLPALESSFFALFLRGEYSIVLELSKLMCICSEGVDVFHLALKEVNRRRGLIIAVRPAIAVRKSMALAGLTEVLQVYDSLDDAFDLFDPSISNGTWLPHW